MGEWKATSNKLRLWLHLGVSVYKTGIIEEFIIYSEIPLQSLASQETLFQRLVV